MMNKYVWDFDTMSVDELLQDLGFAMYRYNAIHNYLATQHMIYTKKTESEKVGE
jgi:hypothetical protein